MWWILRDGKVTTPEGLDPFCFDEVGGLAVDWNAAPWGTIAFFLAHFTLSVSFGSTFMCVMTFILLHTIPSVGEGTYFITIARQDLRMPWMTTLLAVAMMLIMGCQ